MRNNLLIGLISLLTLCFGCGGGHIGSTSAAVSAPSKFTAGIAHVAGNYGFSQNNFLVEGAQKISQLGSDSIFVYLTPWFRTQYPDKSTASWPAANPTSVAQLAQTAPYNQVFNLPFKTIVLTTYTFANADQIAGMAQSPQRQSAEENEFYQLTKYLYTRFSGSGKTFILKNWEGDWVGMGGQGNIVGNIPSNTVQDMIAWLKARQAGVTKARDEANDSSVQVLNGAEVNRVLDYAQQGLTRVINAVVPEVGADMVTYSSYDSTAIGNDAASMQKAFNQALQTIDKLAPDPLRLGKRRILVSEYGLYENQLVGGTSWRSQAILSTASKAGIYGAFLWNLYDNECVQPNGQAATVDAPVGNPARPGDGNCRGLWVVRPDGSNSAVLNVLKKYW
ncbi:MAG TPA: hypothetical protein VN517_16455 [Terriglobales bacterium]|nr:hypothetical protein [Terriglobales bacterium]